MAAPGRGRLRLVAGVLGGRVLGVAPATRPTQEKVRAAVMSRWQQALPGCRFLDVFCGSGAIGCEAWSRGAGEVVLIDHDVATAQRNVDSLAPAFAGAPPPRCVRGELPAALRGKAARGWRGAGFDLVYADPPYTFADWTELLAALAPLLRSPPGEDGSREDAGEIAIEHRASAEPPERSAGLVRCGCRRYGQSMVSYYRAARRRRAGAD